jgi:glutamyl/glutaminyl-tRNA synthetase
MTATAVRSVMARKMPPCAWSSIPGDAFHDQLSGDIHADERLAREDFIIHRRDGLFAYNLAVVVDDHFQGVTEIVRGADLVEPTVRQISLYQQFGWTARTIFICRWRSMRREINCQSKTTPRPCQTAIRALF